MVVSGVVLSMPVCGGALYLACEGAVLFLTLRGPIRNGVIPKALRRTGVFLLILLSLLFLFILITASPSELTNAAFWRLAGFALCMALRPVITGFVVEKAQSAHKKPLTVAIFFCCAQLLFLPALLLLPLDTLSPGTAWALAGGCLVSGVLESLPLGRARGAKASFTEKDKEETQALDSAHACRMYRDVLLVVAAALQITLILAYTYIVLTADSPIICMAIAFLCAFAAVLLADAIPLGLIRRPNFHMLLMAGLFIWLCGLVLFLCSLGAPASVGSYIFLALCSVGAGMCVRALACLEDSMRLAAAFVLGHTPSEALDDAHSMRVRYVSLLGRLAGLPVLTLIGILTAAFPLNDGDGALSRPLTLLALIFVGAAIVYGIRFPLSRLHLDKLRKYTSLRQEGRENKPLHDQLEAVVVQKSIKCYGIRAIIYILWPLCHHKVRGTEKIHLDEDTPCVFVCNHGEIYGPIVAVLYVPYPFRPWVAYEMTDKSVIVDRTMNGTFQDVKGVSRKILQRIMEKYGAPFLAWVMKSVDCIPVYHDNPRKLMQTFRATTTTMEAGDNILLFPENADTSSDGRYVREGVSEFFTGFTMIGQLYYNKTGKCPLFIPLYADKKKRIMTFGEPTRYDPSLPPNEEKERLCQYLRDEMLKIAGMKNQ